MVTRPLGSRRAGSFVVLVLAVIVHAAQAQSVDLCGGRGTRRAEKPAVSRQNQEARLVVGVEGGQVQFSTHEEILDIPRCAVTQLNPDDFRWGAKQECALIEVPIFRHDREAMHSSELPH
jgi:hypothetical protein